MNNIRILILIFLFFLPLMDMEASGIYYRDSIPVPYDQFTFLNGEANVITNPELLDAFYARLAALEKGEIEQVRIVHIGDSHVQADFWTGQLRRLLQKRFGYGGRGLVFPFTLAESHNPTDVHTTSNTKWDYRLNVYKNGPPLGIAGAGIATENPDFFIELTLGDSMSVEKFNKITLFNSKGPSVFDFTLGQGDINQVEVKKIPTKRQYHKVRSGETLSHLASRYGCSVSNIKRWNGLRSSRINVGQKLIVSKPVYLKSRTPEFKRFAYLANTEYPDSIFSATLFLDGPANQLVIKGERQSTTQHEIVFYGVSLENTLNPGILYHSIGVNGATFYHYNTASRFFDQAAILDADLVLVSLGTNESVGSGLTTENFSSEANTFFTNVRDKFPKASVLITTNPAVLKKKLDNKPGNDIIKSVLVKLAEEHGFAIWDLQEVMGGSIKPWQNVSMAQQDGVHFTRQGYELLANLLFNAIMKNYDAGN